MDLSSVKRLLCRPALLVFPLFLAIADAQPTVAINEYSVSGYGAGPITSGSDGALWFPVDGTGVIPGTVSIFRGTTAGVIKDVGSLPILSGVGGIAAGPDGALWFTASNGNIGRVTTSGTFTQFATGANNATPSAITAGPDGALWFTFGSAIWRITTLGAFTQYSLPNASAAPSAITAGPDGALWFTESGSGKIGRIATSGTTITEYPVPTQSTLGGIAAGPDGALWFTETSAGQIGRIITGGVITEYPVPTGSPDSIAAGPDGAMWFTAGTYIGRISTAGAITQYPVPAGAAATGGITAGSDGSMWFTAGSGTNFELGQVVLNPNPVPTVLSITKTHSGSFIQGQTNATYTLTVSNQQAANPTSGLVTVTDLLPSGLSLVNMGGLGWNCGGNSCSRSDELAGGAVFPPITVLVNVLANAGSPQVNMASVSGGSSASASASDSTVILNPPLLSITKTHTGSFAQGQTGAIYTLTVSNQGGPTNGLVSVREMLPAGLVFTSMAGTGWDCGGVTCSRSDILNTSSSYPPITVTVSVASDAGSPQVNLASVSGGGAAAAVAIADSTIITGNQPPSFFAGEGSLGDGINYLVFPDGNLFGYYTHLLVTFIYHYDMGFEYVLPANDPSGDVYFYDFQSGHWWFTGPTLFPNLYDFTLGAWIEYFTDPLNPGHYTTNPRKFSYDATHVAFTM